jgi:pSer/pThr/pTyr-binding forkhead associated (FHA) protein
MACLKPRVENGGQSNPSLIGTVILAQTLNAVTLSEDLTDLNRRNGTMLNWRPITLPTLLKNGDVIRIRDRNVRVRLSARGR